METNLNKKEKELIEQQKKEESLWEENENKEFGWEDRHQGVLFLSYGNPLSHIEFFKELDKLGIGCRILLPIDITFPCFPNKKHNEQINFFKHFCTCQNKDLLEMANKNFMIRNVVNNFLDKKQFKLMNYENWNVDRTNKFLSLGLTPIASQHQKAYRELLKDEQHKKNYDNLNKFISNGYEMQKDAFFGNETPKIEISDDENKTTRLI